MKQTVESVSAIGGTMEVPGDKSISHRSVMIGSIAKGITKFEGFLNADDCLSTINVFRHLGVKIDKVGEHSYLVNGKGLKGLKEPDTILDVGNSGTTIRLISGILAGHHFHSILTGDNSIRRRPMGRIVEPLTMMGADIDGRDYGKYAPLSIRGTDLKGIAYKSPVASAQIKSAILFAGLFADRETTVEEPYLSRNHSEKMLSHFGARLKVDKNSVTIWPKPNLEGQQINVPGDFSSAAFFIAAALIVPTSRLVIKNVGINPTRIGFLEAVKSMNGKVEVINSYYYGEEPTADILIEASQLSGINISGEWIPKIIDELPLLAVIASQAEGVTKVTDAGELRVKETDRIKTVTGELRKVGVEIEELEDGFIIQGKQKIGGGTVSTHGDHRIGMAMAIAGLIAKEKIEIEDTEAINISYPNFFKDLNKITKN